jgi:hypothetical protein
MERGGPTRQPDGQRPAVARGVHAQQLRDQQRRAGRRFGLGRAVADGHHGRPGRRGPQPDRYHPANIRQRHHGLGGIQRIQTPTDLGKRDRSDIDKLVRGGDSRGLEPFPPSVAEGPQTANIGPVPLF